MGLSDRQYEILRYVILNEPVINILEGAVRAGKTYINNYLWLTHLSKYKDEKKDFIVTGHTHGAIDRNILKPLHDDFGIATRLDKHSRFMLAGNYCHCFGSDKEDSYKSMTGMTSYGWYANEISIQHPNTIAEAFNRCSGDGFRIFWDTNPDYPGHSVKVDFIDHSGDKLPSGREWIKSWHFELDDNPYLSEEYKENVKRTTPQGMWYDRRIKGLWVAAEGVVYEIFTRDTHVVEPFSIPEGWKRVRGIDFGYTNPFVCLWAAIDPDGRLYFYREHYENQILMRDHAAAIHRADGPYINEHFKSEKAKWIDAQIQSTEVTEPDARRFRADDLTAKEKYDIKVRLLRGIYKYTVADHDAQERAELEKLGVLTQKAKKDIKTGIERVSYRLQPQKDGKPRIYFFNTLPNTIREMSLLRWPPKKEGVNYKEEPIQEDDHCPDVVRYIVMAEDSRSFLYV